MTAPKRRWFRFSLRTLLLAVLPSIAIVLSWLVWNLNQLRERDAIIARLAALPEFHDAELPILIVLSAVPDNIPATWKLLGATPVGISPRQLDSISEEELKASAETFLPEALVVIQNISAGEVRPLVFPAGVDGKSRMTPAPNRRRQKP